MSAEDYEKECLFLIAQFQTVRNAVKSKFNDIKSFIRKIGMYCPLAEDRLLVSGVPATQIYKIRDESTKNHALLVFELSGHFITLLDALKLNERAVDVILPLVTELLSSLNRIKSLPSSLHGFESIKQWSLKLAQMKAHDEITDEEARQFSLDVDSAYSGFKNWLQTDGRT
ncbi:putative Vacuolar protein sorting-associated protein 28 [Cardiosporidium cionae]|uniref:Vacuolar protein sorting-associated protein 28 n=1 Tax=Cardiosporidium cionae TaxID=476202 RepID=A0ABQ7J6Q7_9APIC|nr:putative Vacuolar protein sorting-associated protein 28 [Cardiosporidium cionae]|eukprot:KAF8819668.1 putative Vacuolar protein sorting-associated protein 28 [Cardiosporidium cionae]